MQYRKTVSGIMKIDEKEMTKLRALPYFANVDSTEFEIVVGSNTGDKDMEEHCFSVLWKLDGDRMAKVFHLKLDDVKKVIKEHEEKHKKM